MHPLTVAIFGALYIVCIRGETSSFDPDAKLTFKPNCKCGIRNSHRALGYKSATSRIVGGTTVHSENEFPWHSAIKRNGRFLCSGVLVTPSNVVTAASCFFTLFGTKLNNNDIRVAVGVFKLFADTTNRQYGRVADVIIHPKYNPRFLKGDLRNNIAIIRLEKPIESIMPVCLPLYNSELGPTAIVTGWGNRNLHGGWNNLLQKVHVTPLKQCSTLVYPSILCTKRDFYRTVCRRDIGDPLMISEGGVQVLQGLAIFGDSCGSEEAAFVSVHHALDWITRNVEESNGCLKKS